MYFVFDLRQLAAILDITHTAMSQVLSGHTLLVHPIHLLFYLAQMTIILDFKTTKQCLMHFIAALRCRAYLKSIMNLLLFCRALHQFIL